MPQFVLKTPPVNVLSRPIIEAPKVVVRAPPPPSVAVRIAPASQEPVKTIPHKCINTPRNQNRIKYISKGSIENVVREYVGKPRETIDEKKVASMIEEAVKNTY